MSINFLILIAAILAQVIGYVWYGPLFGRIWTDIHGLRAEDTKPKMVKNMPLYLTLNFLGNLAMSSALFLFLRLFSITTFAGAFPLALTFLIGFVIPMTINASIWNGKPKNLQWKHWLISTGFYLVTFIVWLLVYTILG